MVTYAQNYGRITDVTGTNAVDIVAPGSGDSQLITALQLHFRVGVDDGAGNPLVLSVLLSDSVGPVFTYTELPLPISDKFIRIDLLRYLSAVRTYGISNPDRIQMKVNSPITANDKIFTSGYSLVGTDV